MTCSNTQFDCICQRLFLDFQSADVYWLLFLLSISSAELSLLAWSCPPPSKKEHNREVSNGDTLLKKVLRLSVVLVYRRSVPRFVIKQGGKRWRSEWLTSQRVHRHENRSYKSWMWENVRKRRKQAGDQCQKED